MVNAISTRSAAPRLALLIACGTCAGLGCAEDKESGAALAPGGGNASTGNNSSSMPEGSSSISDAGPSGTAPSSASSGMLTFFECEALVFGESAPITSPGDFSPTHIFAGWLADCSTPTIVFGLSEGECVRDDACAGDVFGSDEVCLEPAAHRLAYYVEAAAILGGDIIVGPNVVSVDSTESGLTVRYRRPSGIDDPGLYGNCTGSDGLLNIENISTTANTRIGANFNHVLSACGDGDNLAQTVTGSLQVTLTGGQAEACIGGS